MANVLPIQPQNLLVCKNAHEVKCWKIWWQICKIMRKLVKFPNLIDVVLGGQLDICDHLGKVG